MYGTVVPNVGGISPILLDVGYSTSALITPGSSGTFNHYLTYMGLNDGDVMVSNRIYTAHLQSDDSGGPDGPPSDIQYMGETARINLSLSKYDATVASLLSARGYGNTPGQPMAPGALFIAQWLFYRLVINSPTGPINFPCFIPDDVLELGRGTKFSTYRISGTAYKAPANHPISSYRGILDNSDVTDNNWSIPMYAGHT